jgi:cytochrome c5
MSRTALLLVTFAVLFGCGKGAQPPEPSNPSGTSSGKPSGLTAESSAPGEQTAALLGYEVYEAFCASCHDAGRGNAPVTGEPTDWDDRSQLWMAVLTEHVKAGYLDMPARGDQPELTDLSVSKAVEHMMHRTYPEKTRD